TEKNTEKTPSVDSGDEKPAPEKPAPEEPAPEKPAPEKPAPEKPAPEKPVPEKPVPEKPVPEKPVPEKPVPEKPVPEKPGRQPAKLVPSRKARPLAAPDEPIRQPVMAISDYHRATSVLALGDKLPDFELPDLHGDSHTRRSLLTQPLTVIVFWNAAASSSREQFTRLPQEIWDRFGDARVATLAVHVGPAEAEVEKLSAASAVEFPVLLDVEKTLYSQVAKSRLPRTLLVNQAGEVLWMDLEYSRSMRRELVNAIYFHLSKQPAAAKK
ncbi:MAG: redoxin domain-containing protein, partial [Planctomycetota bacterium]